MNLFSIAICFVLLSIANVAVADYSREVWRGRSHGADFDVLFRVVDDEGVAVADAKCSGWMYMEQDQNHGAGYAHYTDTNGFARVSGKCGEWFSVVVRKEGYYQTMFDMKYPVQDANPPIVNGKWQPYGEARTVVLKKIRNLGALKVPLCLVRVETTVPVYGEWLPFDLEKFDWTAPNGAGSHDDVLLRFRRRVTGRWNDFTYEMDVSFTNHPFAGVVKMKKDCSSDFTTVYNANPDADFIPSLNYYLERTEKGGSRSSVLEKDSYLIFRTRTSVDEEGNLKAAHYGTIHGEWMPGKNYMSLTDGCFNPKPNDLNVEDGYQLREVVKHYGDFKEDEK